MNSVIKKYPKYYQEILEATKNIGFNQLSDEQLGSLLSTLVASKPNSKIKQGYQQYGY